MTDFAMNKVCAAGTGSFLEERSRELGIEVCGDFASRALASTSPLDLGSRCTVFMETEVVNALARGETVEDVCAGLAYAIVKNYLDKVVGTRPLGQRILFQGGVASNEAVVAAFEHVLGQPVHVHPYNRISGAIGAALAARANGAGPTVFKGFRGTAVPRLSSFECQHCSNRCEVNVIEVGDSRTFFGDTCERYTSGERSHAHGVPNLAAEYQDSCGAFFGSGAGLRIGVPRASSVMGQLPFWGTFWKELGHQPVLSKASAQETLALGLRHLAVGVCLPVKLIAGHVHALLAEDVDVVFVPSVVLLPGEEPSHAYACPYTMAAPFMLDIPDRSRCLTPVVSFGDEEAFAAAFEPYLDLLSATPDHVRHAYRMAMQTQADFLETFRRRAAELLETGAYRHAFGILGRPYSLFDSFLNLGLFARLARLEVLALPMDFLPEEIRNGAADSALPWYYPYDMHRLSSALARSGRMHPVILTSYGCGPDAFALQQINEQLKGRPHLILELDEHRGEAGLVTRIEAFLDQLEGTSHAQIRMEPAGTTDRAFLPSTPSTVWIPYFADHAYAYSGLLRHLGHAPHVLPLPAPEVRTLGEKYALGKECHAYSMILGDLLQVAAREDRSASVFFFPGTSVPCLLHEYGRGMQALLRELGIEHVQVSAPRGKELVEWAGLKAIERFYTGLLAVELLVKAVCQIRPYELEPGITDDDVPF